jgi:hypothetical protein
VAITSLVNASSHRGNNIAFSFNALSNLRGIGTAFAYFSALADFRRVNRVHGRIKAQE